MRSFPLCGVRVIHPIQNAIAAKLASPIPGTKAGRVDEMTSLLTETLLSNVADIAPPIRRKQVPRGWCATQETKAESNARRQDREDARKRIRSAPNDRGLRRALKATTKQPKRTRAEAVQRFHKLLNTKSPTLDPSIVNELKQWPSCRPLDDVPSRYEAEEAIRALANRKAVGPDGLPAELLKV